MPSGASCGPPANQVWIVSSPSTMGHLDQRHDQHRGEQDHGANTQRGEEPGHRSSSAPARTMPIDSGRLESISSTIKAWAMTAAA